MKLGEYAPSSFKQIVKDKNWRFETLNTLK